MAANLSAFGAELRDYAVEQLEALERTHLPAWRIPAVFAGHRVEPDVAADLAFTLGLLAAGGTTTVAGAPVEEVIGRVLAQVDGPRTHSFFSYRVAETIARSGGLDRANPVLAGLSDERRADLAVACDSSSFVELLDQQLLPRNYAAVLARCELGRSRLGLLDDASVLEDLVGRTAALLDRNPDGFLDDSQSDIARYDIYTGDLYLFTEPLAERLGPRWSKGLANALDLVELVVTTNGAAVCWGRSSGALAACLTIELAALALGTDLFAADRAARWRTFAERAFADLRGWMRDGLIAAHQYRNPYRYRGPHRRLQMSLDCLGKLADAGRHLALVEHDRELPPAAMADAFPTRDSLRWLDQERGAGVWSYRSRDLAFVLPLVGSTVSDYLPAPHNPGLFEVPVDADLPTAVPSVYRGGVHFTSGQTPAAVTKVDDGLRLHYDGFPESGQFEWSDEARSLAGSRIADLRVTGRTLRISEALRFDEVPDAVALQVAEAAGRPLQVVFECAGGHAATVIDTAGVAEYRSFWGELPRVHQLDLEPAAELSFSWSVTPKLRVLTTAAGHHYHESLYAPLADRVAHRSVPFGRVDDAAAFTAELARWDQLHLHWPEWFLGFDVERHRRVIDTVVGSGARIVWTQHNLVPHQRDDRAHAVYQLWAEAADGVIHHSRWGMEQVLARYRFGPGAEHRVIFHGHFGNLTGDLEAIDRAEAERELGLTPGKVRLGVIGAPRAEKQTAMVMDAFAACGRDDLELLVCSLGPGETARDHPGIVALAYDMVPREVYNRRLRVLDALVLPFAPGGMLTTGTVGDAIAAGIPSIVSDWPFLAEVLGDAAIGYGRTRDDLVDCLRSLDQATLDRAGAAARALRPRDDWSRVAELTFELLEAVGTSRL